MKKIVSYILILSIILSFNVYADNEITSNAVSERKFIEELNFLESIGISNAQILSKDTITRGEFISLVLNAFYPEEIFRINDAAEGCFYDVNATHPCFSEIKAAKDMGIINGSGDNRFFPDEPIGYSDALVIITKTLGLKYHAIANGGYPTGYHITANTFGISKGTDNSGEKLSGDTASKLIYNALFSDYAEQTSVKGNGEISVTISPDKNLLYKNYNISKYDARIISTPISAIEGDITDFGRITLKLNDGSLLSVWTENNDIQFELGKTVTVYIRRNKETGKEEVVYFSDYKKLNQTVLFGSEIINVTANYIEYETDNNKFKKVLMEEFPDVIYNGVLQKRYDYNSFKPEDAVITFYDADGNGKNETISIVSFNYSGMFEQIAKNDNSARNIVADVINIDKQYISCKWNPRNNLNLDPDYAHYIIKSSNEEIKKLEDIKPGDIISVAEAPGKFDEKTVYFLFVERKNANLMYESVNTSDNILSFVSKDYEVSSSIYTVRDKYYNNLISGSDVQVSFDVCGKIAYIANLQTTLNSYAYLMAAKVNFIDGEDTLVVKILEGTNYINTYNVSKKAKIDSQIYDSAQKQYEALVKRPSDYGKWINSASGAPYENGISRPLIVKFNNSNEISVINTDTPDLPTVSEKVLNGDIGSPSEERNVYTDANSIGYSDEEAYDSQMLKAGYRAPRTDLYREATSSVQGKFYITSNTYIFRVPDIDTCGFNDYGAYLSNPGSNKKLDYNIIKTFELEKDDSNYKVVLQDTLTDENKYDIQAYNIDPDTYIAEMVVIRGRDVNTVSDDGDALELCVYLGKNTYYDSVVHEEKEKIYYTVDGVTKLSAIYDKNTMHPAYNYIINGVSSRESIFGTETKPLEKGDIIRVSVKGDRLIHIERILVMKELESSYSSLAKTRLPEGYFITSGRIWYDVNASTGGTTGSYSRYLLIPDRVNGSFVHCIMGGATDTTQGSSATYTLSDIDIDDPSTYVSFAADFGDVKPCLVTLLRKSDGSISEVKVKEGSLNDLRSLEEGYSVKNASRVIFKNRNLAPTQIIIINYENID